MSIDGTNVVKSQFLEQSTTRNETTGVFIDTLVHALDIFWKKFVEGFCEITEILERLGNQQIGRVSGKLGCWDGTSGTGCSGGKTDLTIIVQYHDHSGLQITSTVHGFVGHPSRDRTISDDSNAVVLSLVQNALCNAHSLRRRNGGGRVPRTERIVFTFFPFAESRETTQLTECWESVPSSSQNLVWVALMGNVPNNIVVGHVKNVMKGNRKFSYPQ
mmetsp:Transcript_16109/g.44588  ORF Transcript_16109/g.44588 Transcript_16109/m.44588 type:complete len:217 (+) Transcript_16109:1966-2616(+)